MVEESTEDPRLSKEPESGSPGFWEGYPSVVRLLFRSAGARSFSNFDPRLAMWAAFFRRFAARSWKPLRSARCLVARAPGSGHSSFSTVGADDVEHEENDGQVADEQGAPQGGHTAKKFADLKGQEQGARNQGYPLGPGATSPQAIAFCEAQRCIRKSDASRRPQARVGHVVGEVEKELGGTAIGTDMEQGEQTLCVEPDILVHESKRTESHQHHKNTLEEFEGSYGLEHLPLTAV